MSFNPESIAKNAIKNLILFLFLFNTYNWVDLVDQSDSLLDLARQDELPNLHPMVDQLLIEINLQILVFFALEVYSGLFNELFSAFFVPFGNEKVQDQSVHKRFGYLYFVQLFLPIQNGFTLI
jgi:hypothetical protein